SMYALVMFELSRQVPRGSELMHHPGACLEVIRRMVVGRNRRACVLRSQGRAAEGRVHGLERLHPPVLRQVIEVESRTGADDCVTGPARGICQPEARGEGVP